MGKKLRVTIAVVILLALVSLGIVTTVGGDKIIGLFSSFFSSIFSGLSLPDNAIRNVSFELHTTEYPNITFSISDAVNVTIDSTNFTIYSATTLNARSAINIMGFKGTIAVFSGSKNVSVSGSYESITIGDVTIASAGSISESHTIFSSVFLEGMKMKILNIPAANGTLLLNNMRLELLNQTVEIASPIANFYYRNDMAIIGKASRITVRGDKTIVVNN